MLEVPSLTSHHHHHHEEGNEDPAACSAGFSFSLASDPMGASDGAPFLSSSVCDVDADAAAAAAAEEATQDPLNGALHIDVLYTS